MPAVFIEDLSSPALQEFLKECDTALIPIASIETHGPHLSLCADPLVADGILRRAAPLIEADLLILPLIHYAIVCQHGFERNPVYPGNYGVREETLTKYLIDIAHCLARDGMKKLVLYNGHGGNTTMLRVACVDIEKDIPGLYCFSYFVINGMKIQEMFPGQTTGHGGPFETSLDMALCPDHVWMHTDPPAVEPRRLEMEKAGNLTFFPDWVYSTRGHGYVGDPKGASAEKGEQLVAQALDEFVPTMEELARLDVAELEPVEKPNEPFD